jgi:hypothetical protein
MAVVVNVVIPGLTRDQYDALRASTNWLEKPPDGGLSHVTWWEGDDCHNLDTWEDETSFVAFGQDRLGPAIAALGIHAEVNPVFRPAHEVFLPAAKTLTAT